MKYCGKILFVLALLVPLGTAVQAKTFVRMVSGPAGGSWYSLGAKIAEVLGYEVPDIAISNEPGGSVGNVGNVKDVNRDNAELGHPDHLGDQQGCSRGRGPRLDPGPVGQPRPVRQRQERMEHRPLGGRPRAARPFRSIRAPNGTTTRWASRKNN